MSLLYLPQILLCYITICIAEPNLSICISEIDSIVNKGLAKGLKCRTFKLNGKKFNYIHNDKKTRPERSISKYSTKFEELSFIIGGKTIIPHESIQLKLLNILTRTSDEILLKAKGGIPTCLQLEQYISDGPLLEPRTDYSDKFERIEQVDSIQDFSSVFLINPTNFHLIHAVFYLSNNICLSKIGSGKTLFHTLDNVKRFYSTTEKKELIYARLKWPQKTAQVLKCLISGKIQTSLRNNNEKKKT